MNISFNLSTMINPKTRGWSNLNGSSGVRRVAKIPRKNPMRTMPKQVFKLDNNSPLVMFYKRNYLWCNKDNWWKDEK